MSLLPSQCGRRVKSSNLQPVESFYLSSSWMLVSIFGSPPGVIPLLYCLLLAGLRSLLGLGPGTEGLLTGTRLLFIRAPVRCLDLLCTKLLVPLLVRSTKSVYLALLVTSASISLTELDAFWLVHFSCPPESLCFAYFLTGCRLLSPCLAFFCRGLFAAALEVLLLYRCGCIIIILNKSIPDYA